MSVRNRIRLLGERQNELARGIQAQKRAKELVRERLEQTAMVSDDN